MFPRNFRQFAIQLLAALLIAVICFLALRSAIPGIVQNRIVSALEHNGIDAKSLTVDSVGWSETQLGLADLALNDLVFGWDSAAVEYFPNQLLNGEVGGFYLQGPVLELPFHSPLKDADPSARRSLANKVPANEGQLGATGIPKTMSLSLAEACSNPSGDADPEARSRPENPAARLGAFFEQLPFAEIGAKKGRLLIREASTPVGTFDWSGQLMNGHDRVMGEVWLGGAGVDANLRLDGLKSARVFKGQAEAQVDLQNYISLLRMIFPRLMDFRFIHPLALPETIELDVLLELDAVNALVASGQLTSGGMKFASPSLDGPLGISNLFLAGTYQDRQSRVNGGIRLEPFSFRGLHVRETGIVFAVEGLQELSINSEETGLAMGNWTGKAAFRGTATWENRQVHEARLEMAVSSLTGGPIAIEPFSTHMVYSGNLIHLKWSPLGIRQVGVLWLEKANLSWNFATNEGNGSFSWYDTAGAHAGNGRILASRNEDNGLDTSLILQDTDDKPVLETAFSSGNQKMLQLEGAIPLPWLNILNRWAGNFLPGSFAGQAPAISARLSGDLPFLKGFLRFALEGMDFTVPEKLSLYGIEGNADLEFNLFPRTTEAVEMRVRSLTAGRVELSDLRWVLEMPTLRILKIRSAEAKLATGRVWLDPFQVDPFAVEFLSRLYCRGIPANLILEWLGESRFMVEGYLAGNFPIGWESGSLLLGEGSFQLTKQEGESYFRFLDKEFMTQQVSSLSSLPEDIRKRLLSALLEKGIRLDSLKIEVAQGPAPGIISLRLSVSGESTSDEMSIPIKGLVINNLISGKDLGALLGMEGPVKVIKNPPFQEKLPAGD